MFHIYMQTQLRKINYKPPNLLHLLCVWHLSGVPSLFSKLQEIKALLRSSLILDSHLLNELLFEA